MPAAPDPLDRVRAARAADDNAQAAATTTARALRETVQEAAAAGVPKVHIADAAGVSRQTLYGWLTQPD